MAAYGCDTKRTAAGSVVVRTFDESCDIELTSVSRSIHVTGFQASTTAEDLIIHFQRKKNGGGDIESIAVSKRGIAVITFEKPEVVTTVLQNKQAFGEDILTVKLYLDAVLENDQPFEFQVFDKVKAELSLEYVESISRDQTENVLTDIAAKTGVKWIDSVDTFTMSGTFKQVKASRAFLQQGIHQSNGVVVVDKVKEGAMRSQRREESRSQLDGEAEKEGEANHDSSMLEAANKETHSDRTSSFSSDYPEIQSFEIEPKIVKAFFKSHKNKLDDIEANYKVEIPKQPEGKKISLKPKNGCSAEEYDEACNQFIELYQKMYQLVKMERFSLKSGKTVVYSRDAILKAGKKFPISIEVCKDRKSWEIYGEASHIEEALKYLEQEGLEIKRETEMAMDEDGKRRTKQNEEDMDIDSPDYSKDAKFPDNPLVTYVGKVRVSVYKGDITKEQVDVIVNAANRELDHAGGVAKAIRDQGGKSIEKECLGILKQRGKNLDDGEAVSTKSGKLPCKAVVHAVGPKWDDVGAKKGKKILRRACLGSFNEAQKLNMTSIALPAIGSGIYGMPKDVCAEIMFDAVEEFVRQGGPAKKTITDVRFVNIDEPSVVAFGEEFMKRYADKLVRGTPGGDSVRFSPTGAEGGTSTAPSSRSNRGRNSNKNVANKSSSIVNPRSGAGGQDKHKSFGSSGANNSDPLGASGNTSSPNASYSGVVKGDAVGKGARPPIVQQPGYHEGKGGFSLPTGGDEGKKDKKEEECPICLDTLKNPRALRCKHKFCSNCLQKALDVSNKCPVCQEPQGVLKGNQPPGRMTVHYDSYTRIPGYRGASAIVIHYSFSGGVQGSEHPNPGQYYDGTSRTAYLPNTEEGQEVLQLLKRAFDARLVFTIGTSNTTGLRNQITWNDIHHKTSVSGGTFGFGYPDPDYLRRVKEELALKGIR